MKKTYSKPALFAESFELAEHIANCAGVTPGAPTHWSKTTCGYRLDGPGTGMNIIFLEAANGCTDITEEDDLVFCYNNWTGMIPPFSS